MNRPKISLICAMDKKRGIGKNNDLLFKIPEDLKRFRMLTLGQVIVMGRKTYESIIASVGHPLTNRVSIVVTRDENYKAAGCMVCHTLEAALSTAIAHTKDEIFIIGGGQIYNQTIDVADRLYLTIVEAEYDAEVYFPEYSDFKKVTFEKAGKSGELQYKFIDLEKEDS